MKRIILFLTLFFVFSFSANVVNQAIAVPSYFYPGAIWDTLNSAAPKAHIAIINPYNGPGEAVDPNYVNQLISTQAVGVQVLGYVATKYSAKTLFLTKGEIDLFLSFYPSLDGIFLDETSTHCEDVAYYKELYRYIRKEKKLKIVAINPGVQTQECYARAADIIMSFENSYPTYKDSYVDAEWVYSYPSSLFWHVVYNVSDTAEVDQVVALSKQRNAAWIYATDDVLLNPYNTLPATTLWDQLLSQVQPGRLIYHFEPKPHNGGYKHQKDDDDDDDDEEDKKKNEKPIQPKIKEDDDDDDEEDKKKDEKPIQPKEEEEDLKRQTVLGKQIIGEFMELKKAPQMMELKVPEIKKSNQFMELKMSPESPAKKSDGFMELKKFTPQIMELKKASKDQI